MPSFPVTITDAGRAEIVNANNTGTGPVLIAEVGFGTGAYAPDPAQTALGAETKRLGTVAGVMVADDTIHVSVVDESGDAYDIAEFGLYTDNGTLFAVYSDPSGTFMQKAAQSALLLAIDIQLATISAASLSFGTANFANPPASETIQGVIELADTAEARAGTDAVRAMTPATARAAMGRFGLGGAAEAVPGDDADQLALSGLYTATGATAGAPGPGILSHFERELGVGAAQLWFDHTANAQHQRSRDAAGTWSAWAVVALGAAMDTSFAANGYAVLPNGLIVQWGLGSGTSANFPIAFPNALLFASISDVGSGPSAYAWLNGQSDATQVTVSAPAGQSTPTWTFLALGH
ncbi:MAG: phage tail protein [Rhodobacteraceae bacterium]|nr:phage tail protein [Paracoccaceae bacterium]